MGGVEGTLSQVLMDERRANRKCLEYSLEGMDRGNLRQAFSSWYDSCASGPKEIIVRVGGASINCNAQKWQKLVLLQG